MVTTDDLADTVTAQVQGTSGFSTSLPGGIWFERAPDTPPAYPYAVFRLEGGDKENFSGGLYIQAWILSIAAYVEMGETVTPPGVEQFLNSALVTVAAQDNFRNATLRNPNDRILDSRPDTDSAEFDTTLKSGKDLFSCGLECLILVQGDRNVT